MAATSAVPRPETAPARAAGPLLGRAGSVRRRLAGNAAWSAGTFAANAVVTFFLSPFVVSALGDSAYGLWLLVLSLTGYFGFADLGIRPAIVHFVARHDALGECDEVNRYVSSAVVAFALGGAVVLAASATAPLWLGAAFGLEEALVPAASLAVALVGLDFALTLPLNAFSAVLVGKQRYGTLGRADLATLVLRTAGVVVALRAGGGIAGLAAVQLGSSLFEMGWKTFAAFRAEPRLRFSVRLADRRRAKDLVRYGVLGIVVALGSILAHRSDAVIVRTALPLAAITLFQVPAQLAFHARAFLGAASRVLTPAAGALDARGDARGVARLLENGSRATFAAAAPVLAWLLAAGEPFLARWMGERFRGEPSTVLAILALATAAPVATLPFGAVLYGVAGMRAMALFAALEGVAKLALSLALVRPMGIVGVAVGSAVPALLVHGWLLPKATCARFGVGYGAFAARAWTPSLLGGIAAYLAVRSAVAPGASLSYGPLFLLAGLSVAAFGAVFLAATALLPGRLGGRRSRP
jgi:O-antigen/teichoic acid export membrane protein